MATKSIKKGHHSREKKIASGFYFFLTGSGCVFFVAHPSRYKYLSDFVMNCDIIFTKVHFFCFKIEKKCVDCVNMASRRVM
jgi:hypothetical protein